MLRLEHISKIYSTGEVLKDVTWEVKPGERVGLVGVNGAGKSTQLKIITGEVEPTAGEVIRPASLRIAYLTQEFEVEPTRTVKEEFWTVFIEANEVQQALNQLHHEMETAEPEELNNNMGPSYPFAGREGQLRPRAGGIVGVAVFGGFLGGVVLVRGGVDDGHLVRRLIGGEGGSGEAQDQDQKK